MEFTRFFFIVLALLISFLNIASAFPFVKELPSRLDVIQKDKQGVAAPDVPTIPGRLTCPHEEATEDVSCQKHCLPKGYSYGICVSGTCSCI